MCGFVILVSTQPPAHRHLRLMLDSIRSRGPDDLSYAQGEWFALGFCRLSIMVLGEGGRQPVTDEAAGVHLVFNGEIYNFPSIQKQLRRDFGIVATSEAEALLQLYLKHGTSFVEQLDGDYGAVLLDSRSRTCLAFRDPFGVKPLYYAALEERRTWILSSHLKAFFHHPDFSTPLDSVALMERRVLGFWSSHLTCFAAIDQLTPGHCLRLQVIPEGQAPGIEHQVMQFSSPHEADIPRGGEVDAGRLDIECAQIIGQAVRRRVEHSDVNPIVLALSGGVDSSLMAALAPDLRDRLTAVTIFDSEECRDQEYAARLARGIGLTHQVYRIALSEFLDEFPTMVLEMAGANPNYTPYFLGRAMKQLYPSAKVLLCGEGADEFFIGYPLLLDSEYFWSSRLNTLCDFPAAQAAESPLLRQVWRYKSMGREAAWRNLVDMFQRDQLVNLHLVPFDHGTMAHGVECRVPYLDYGVINFIRRVPAHLRVLGSTTKVILRILLAQALGPDTSLAQSLLTRLPSPAFFSTLGCRHWLREFLREKLPHSRLAQSELASFAKDEESLFWLASVAIIFLKHRGRIDGMRFHDLADEVFSWAGSSWVNPETHVWGEKRRDGQP